jgi:hypothetical protein
VTQLINHPQNHAFGEIEMIDSQVKPTAILLKKARHPARLSLSRDSREIDLRGTYLEPLLTHSR